MPFFKYVLAITGLVFLHSCKQNDLNTEFKIKIKNSVNLSELFYVEKQIKVKYDNPLAPIESLKKFKENYLALINGNLYKMDNDGTIIQKLKTPENAFLYKGISSFDVYNDQIYTVERSVQKIKIFDGNFQLMHDYHVPYYILSFKVISEGIILFYMGFDRTDEDKNQVYLYDLNEKKILASYLDIKKNLSFYNFRTKYNIFEDDNKIYFSNGMDATLYNFDNKVMRPVMKMDYGAYALPSDFYDNSKYVNAYEYVEHTNNIEKVSRFYNLIKFDKYIFKHISLGKQRYFVFKNLDTGHEYTTATINEDMLNSGEITTDQDQNGFLGSTGDQLAIYIENSEFNKDSSYVGTILLGKFKF
jgi:hypothetical protein